MSALPFSEGQFLRVFADYNRAVWPAQLVLYTAALLTVFALGITEDYGLIPAGLAGAFLVVRRNRHYERHTPAAVTA